MYGPPVTRLPLFLLRFLILMAVVWPDLASAATSTNVETRVMGIALVAPTLVGGSSARSPEKHLGSSLAYDEIAPGYSLAAEGATAALRFSQTTASAAFSADGAFAGKTIGSLAGELRAGTVAVGDVPVGVTNGLIVNTRSSLALMRAGIPQSNWVLIDATESEGANIAARLIRNGLGPEGVAGHPEPEELDATFPRQVAGASRPRPFSRPSTACFCRRV